MSNTFKCDFIFVYEGFPLTNGSLYFGGNFEKEDLRTDDKLLNEVLSGIYDTLSSNAPNEIDKEKLSVITYFSDLVD